jgi:hypothetical protein
MKSRKARALLIVPALVLGMLVPMMGEAHAAPAASVCVVAGLVNVNPGVGGIPPGGDNNGTYTFNQVALVCAGALVGVGTGAASAGEFGSVNCGGVDVPLFGSFCDGPGNGTAGYNAGSGYLVGGTCSGTVGGDEGALANAGNGDWSLTFGVVIAGGMTCTSGAMTAGVGVISLVAEPVLADTFLGVGTADCPAPAPLFTAGDVPPPVPPAVAAALADAAAPKVWFCQIAIEGVAVLVQSA